MMRNLAIRYDISHNLIVKILYCYITFLDHEFNSFSQYIFIMYLHYFKYITMILIYFNFIIDSLIIIEYYYNNFIFLKFCFFKILNFIITYVKGYFFFIFDLIF